MNTPWRSRVTLGLQSSLQLVVGNVSCGIEKTRAREEGSPHDGRAKSSPSPRDRPLGAGESAAGRRGLPTHRGYSCRERQAWALGAPLAGTRKGCGSVPEPLDEPEGRADAAGTGVPPGENFRPQGRGRGRTRLQGGGGRRRESQGAAWTLKVVGVPGGSQTESGWLGHSVRGAWGVWNAPLTLKGNP